VISPTKTPRYDSFRDGRDEMNLIEFPFATLSERTNGQSILEFQRETYCRIIGKPVTRKLTVTGDAKYGLPTAKDEEVYLGLLQLTKLHNDFKKTKVYFTRSQLIKLMGWKNRDWSYHRVNRAFHRLTGVRLFYENAWRDNAKKRFCDQGGFALLDSFQIRDGRIYDKDGDETERLSEFRWNSVIFDSFQSGYLKKLDYSVARELGSIARRIYRYLDKHFHPPHRTSLTLPLKTFAYEHIGMSRKSDNAQIKRAIAKPIRELEVVGFLSPSRSQFRKISGHRSDWEVVFTMAGHRRPKNGRGNQEATKPSGIPKRPSRPDKLDRYIASLNPAERSKVEDEAMASATGFFKEAAETNESGPLAAECRRQVVKAFLKRSKE